MAQITVGTAKNAVMILKINNLFLANVLQNAYMRGHYRFGYINDSEWGYFFTLFVDSTEIASSENSATYIRITLNDSSIKADGFATQPPVTGGTPIFTVSATDSTYLTSGAWTYDNSYYTFVSFTSNDPAITVSYDANGGTGTAPATQTGANSYTVSSNTFSKTGYTFNGWNTAANGSGTSYAVGSTITTDATLYAQWGLLVTYDPNGGSVYPASAIYGTTALTLPTPTRTGYTFKGWYTEATGGTQVASPYTPTSAVTIYAQWEEIAGLHIYLGGTTGAKDGTREIVGDGIGAELGEVGSVATFFLRTAPNYKTSETLTVYAPLDCEVSSDGINYGAACTYAAGAIQDVNVPCYIERIAMTQTGPRVETTLRTYPHCVDVTIEAARTELFSGTSLNTTLWNALTAANGTINVADGMANLNSPATTDGMLLYRKTAIDRAANKTYKWKSKLNSAVKSNNYYFFALEDTDAPFEPNQSTGTTKKHSLSYQANSSTEFRVRLSLIASSNISVTLARGTNVAGGTSRWFDPATNAWVASGQVYPAIAADTWYVSEFSTNTSSQWRFRFLAADETTVIFDTGWQNWSGITSFTNSPYLIVGGEPYTNVSIASAAIDWYDEV